MIVLDSQGPYVFRPIFRCPFCGDLVCQEPIEGENAGIVCAGPLGHIVIERREAA